MDSEEKKLETSSSPQKNGQDICEANMKEGNESAVVEDNSENCVNKTPEILSKTIVTSTSDNDSEVIFDGDNTQFIIDDECAKENENSNIENMDCDSEILGSSIGKDESTGMLVVGNEKERSNGLEDSEIDTGKQHCEILDSSEKFDETLVIDTDEEMSDEKDKNDIKSPEDGKADGKAVQEDEQKGSFGEYSQATTVDIDDLDDKALNSPEDLFASQLSTKAVKNNSENSLMDSEDFIPSSLQSESGTFATEDASLVETASVSTSHKRKLDDVNEVHVDTKVPRLETSIEVNASELPCNDKEESKDTNEVNSGVVEKISVAIPTSTNADTESQLELCNQETDDTETVKENLKEKDPVNTDKNKSEHLLENVINTQTFKDTRKSVEIVFSSFEKTGSQDSGSLHKKDHLPRTMPTVPEENGGGYDDEMEDMHLRMSLSPTQGTQSFSETDISKDEGESKSMLTERSNEDTSTSNNFTNSHNGSNSSYTVNSHSLSESHNKIPDTVTVHDNSDLQISSPDEKVASSNDIMVLHTVENSSIKQSTDSDVTVLLDKTEGSGSSRTELTKHKDMNGPLLKRKHQQTEDDGEKIVVLEESDKTNSEIDLRKRSRPANLFSDGSSTPDLPLLLPHKESALPLRDVECTVSLKCHLHLQVNDDLQQVHAIEILQCQDVKELMFIGITKPRESSGGSAADESKNSSPSSVTSLGPFSLNKTQLWRLSSSSTSTTSSGHSIMGMKSKSADSNFTAQLMPPPTRNNRKRYVHLSSEFSSDLFELLEKRFHVDERESKVPCLSSNNPAPLPPSSPILEKVDGATDITHNKTENETHVVETPKSTKKVSRGSRNTRSAGRNLASKIMKGIKEEEGLPQPTPEKETQVSGETSGSQRKPRKTPARSSKRNTPISQLATDDPKVSPSIGPSSGRSRRNRNDQNQNEKVESSSHESSHVYDWEAEGCFSKLVSEAPVFARWTDKKYYPGRVKEKIKDGRWVIEFDDKTVRPLKEEFIIPINILTKGQIVFAYDGEDYEQGIIVEFKLKDGEVQYGVDLDSGRKLFVPRSRLFMSEDQARLLQENMDPKSPTTSSPALTTVSCDNIVHHKRPRATRVLFGNASPSVSGVSKTAKRPSHDTSCSSSVSDSNDKGSTLVLDEVCGVDPEVPTSFPESLHTPSGRGKGPGRIKSKTRTPRRNVTANHLISEIQESNTLHEVLGPIPVKGSKMFSGKCFLLTHSGSRLVDNTKTMTSSKSSKKSEQTSGSEFEDFSTDDGIASKVPFVKDHLRRQLEAGGGTVFENLEDVPEDQYQNCFLIADRPSLTAKYILCLASGIRILNHLWVIEEAKGCSRSWNSARLQAGWDLEGQRYVPPEATVRTRKQKPLNKKEVGIVNESQTFIKFWEHILELLGANVRHISPGSPEQDRQFSGVDVILTDSTCPPEVQDRAREWSIPLVSTVWVTQSLITWRIRPYSGHSHYRYDYCASE